LVENLQITAREVRNKNVDIKEVLKFITWKLKINITLVKMVRSPRESNHKLFSFYYQFQNTLIKLMNKPSLFKSIHVICYLKKYYILNEQPNYFLNEPRAIFPLLLKRVNPQSELTYKSFTVRADDILDIVQRKSQHLSFPFTINIYTSYSSINEKSKEIEDNMIGQFLAKHTEEVFHVFLTPTMESINQIKINALKHVKKNTKFNKHSLFVNTIITEGDKTTFCKTPKEVLLNQKFCICDHEETQLYSPSRPERNLGILPHSFIQKKRKKINPILLIQLLIKTSNIFSMKI
jgi:hypothetical protein